MTGKRASLREVGRRSSRSRQIYSTSIKDRYEIRKGVLARMGVQNLRDDKLLRIYEDAMSGIGRRSRHERRKAIDSADRVDSADRGGSADRNGSGGRSRRRARKSKSGMKRR